jgi:nucleotide-binding universal stress UspA family protein
MIIRRILCPTDFSETSARAVEQAVTVAGYYRAAIAAAAFFKGATTAGLTVDVRVELAPAVRRAPAWSRILISW